VIGQSIEHKKWLLLLLSAWLLNAAFFNPHYCSWCVFLFLIPIFYLAIINPSILSFKEGFYWGALFFSFHFYAFGQLIIERAEGRYKLGALLFLIMYCALHAGLWFWSASWLSKNFSKYALKFCIFFFWVLITYCYFYWMQHGVPIFSISLRNHTLIVILSLRNNFTHSKQYNYKPKRTGWEHPPC